WIQSARVGGIIMDYHYKSLHNQVEPLILIPQEGSTHITHIYLKGQTRDFRAVDEAIRHHWEPASYKLEFVDEKLMTNYQKEKEAISIIFYFSALSLFISILGLFGVMTYILKRRLYEIGIRKVLGAEVKDLLRLFGREIIILLAVATIITFPMIIFLKQKLLGLYAFKPEFNNTWLLLPCLVIMILAYLMVGFQVISASNINPSKLLRDE
ncbi:MAG: FtsX-like permease family protein, partial [Marinoscillum sp.]